VSILAGRERQTHQVRIGSKHGQLHGGQGAGVKVMRDGMA
jgi:hypothetical protein